MSVLNSGDIPAAVVPHLCGALLTALKKKSGGLHPIVVGDVLRKFVSKYISFAVSSEAFEVLSPRQAGVGTPFGCEAVVHEVNEVLNDESVPSRRKWILQVDFSNAFNSVDRACFFKEVRENIPSMSAWIELLHLGKQSLAAAVACSRVIPKAPFALHWLSIP